MGIGAVLAKISWARFFRLLPGIIGLSGELLSSRREQSQSDHLKRLEEQQRNLAETTSRLVSGIKVAWWVSMAALLVALAALAVALMK